MPLYQSEQLRRKPSNNVFIINKEINHRTLCIQIKDFESIICLTVFVSVFKHDCDNVAVIVVRVGLYSGFFLLGVDILA